MEILKKKEKILADGQKLAEKAVVLMVTPRTKQAVNDIMSGLGYVLTETLNIPRNKRKALDAPPMGLRYERELGEKPPYVEDIDLKGWIDPKCHKVVALAPTEDIIHSFVIAGFQHKNMLIVSFFMKEL